MSLLETFPGEKPADSTSLYISLSPKLYKYDNGIPRGLLMFYISVRKPNILIKIKSTVISTLIN